MQDGSNSIANALELLQSCTKPSEYTPMYMVRITLKYTYYFSDVHSVCKHWNAIILIKFSNVIILMKFSSMADLEVVILTTSSAASDANFRQNDNNISVSVKQCTKQARIMVKHRYQPLLVLKPEYSWQLKSIQWLMMSWLLASPSHQPWWCCL